MEALFIVLWRKLVHFTAIRKSPDFNLQHHKNCAGVYHNISPQLISDIAWCTVNKQQG
jgi:hypothetical protein